ncbi:MAG: putative peptidoglycan lipid flippase [Eubacteriales bacterium]|nr:putative peptidoglycan lipid flippase [Eubacteriales bacterium]MDN5364679.1 putative peptidoglycan lipid flippase [Eubacteriales bacterium]
MSGEEKKALFSTTLVISLLLFCSKVLGFIRETVIASAFGTSMEADAFAVAAVIPMMIFQGVSAAVAATFIPVYATVRNNRGEGEANAFAGRLGGTLLLLACFFAVVAIIFAPWLVRLVSPGFSAAKARLTVDLTRILMPLVVANILTGWASGYFQARQRFYLAALSGYPFNIAVITGTLVFASTHGIYALGYATLAGGFASFFLFSVVAYYLGLRLRFSPFWRDADILRVARLSVPVLINSTVASTGIVVDRLMASYLPTGAIAALNYGALLQGFVSGIFIMSLSMVALPDFSRFSARAAWDELKVSLNNLLRLMFFIITPMATGLAVLAGPIVTVLFQRGRFDAHSVAWTSLALLFYSPGLLGIGGREILNRAFYSLQDTRTPTVNAILAIGLNIVLNLALIRFMGHAGLALGSSVSVGIAALLLYRALVKRLGHCGGRRIASTAGRALLAAALMAVVLFLLGKIWPFPVAGKSKQVVWLGVNIFCGAVVYLAGTFLLRMEETALVKEVARRILKKGGKGQEGGVTIIYRYRRERKKA